MLVSRSRVARTALIAVVTMTGWSPVAAQEQTESPPGEAERDAAAEREPGAVQAVFKDYFALRTADGKNEIRVGGAAHLDARAFFADSVAPDSFDIRRARLDVRGRLHGFMTMRLQASLENDPYIRNAWLDLERSPALHLRVGQMKVPFSTSWMTLDNQVNFAERGTTRPMFPFFDRGMMVWGELFDRTLTYSVGAYNGSGLDVDASRGDIDDHKDVVVRLFAQPFRASRHRWLRGLYLAGGGTFGKQSVPTRRFELRGLDTATYESKVWRWRTEQVIGESAGFSDRVCGEIDARTRLGGEVHYIHGRLAASFEWVRLVYDDISLYHDFYTGSRRIEHRRLVTRDGGATSHSAWVSWFVTGERKRVTSFGWRQPEALRPLVSGERRGWGALELLTRFSATRTDAHLFDTVPVQGFGAEDLSDPEAVPVGAGGTVTAAVLQGARKLNEVTIGANWTLNHNLRLQLDYVTLWAPDFEPGSDGIVSGGSSNLSDPTAKNRLVERETALILRFIFRI